MSKRNTGNDTNDAAEPGGARGARHETTANATWSRMLAGNRRFSQGVAEHPWQDRETRASLIDQQNPDAVVLSCSDSRVPPEIIFDEGLGDLFTVRTAGQMLDEAVLASMEYAISHLHVSLLVVLGHEGCGAVKSAVSELDALTADLTARRRSATTDSRVDASATEGAEQVATGSDTDTVIFERIDASDSIILRSVGFSVQQARSAGLSRNEDYEQVHVAHTIEELAARSPVVRQALAEQRLMIVGARYRLAAGVVEVLSF